MNKKGERMRLEKDFSWVSDEDFKESNPLHGKITTVEKVKGKFGDDILLFIDLGKDIKTLSIYKKNLNVLIQKFGNETNDWKGKDVTIKRIETLGGKVIRELSV
jgi:hypothetical protein